ncbi:UDP-3-O-[3-hydroxymyristoyl] N-acetylglucosamine deacetylase [Acetobacter estunensis NRIC 0472]|uniref:UDP-3-O-acyl-N-acetylglucosamine deacetylase n=1 Tax=Acetobacter estunensis TaxID=104097 RepID=A0A967B733_9PROT|nr:UDP-3-O-acyl-N-acetylglucosamine deacetylase [Acetobacter estunensis]NHO53599.1 UDP-3-O-acyl-N-acetylglucosamine deacetylase [Acetobacter estunensis]GBQ20977.1 UDP-3-O-[3-hydroxymyristoyl] N-acetylglucosamine deacetylase [Acetobacter estunensis NRIC 0472]
MDTLSIDPIIMAEADDDVLASMTVDLPSSVSVRSKQVSSRAPRRRTLRFPISCTGVGLHTGSPIRLVLEPAAAGTGIVFQRIDIAGAAPLPARYDHVVDTRLSTVIGDPTDPLRNRIATIEHLMAALCGSRIDDVRVLVDGPEVPVLDGSAADFVFLLDCAGSVEQKTQRREIEIKRTVRVEDGDAFAQLHPCATQQLDMTIDFPARAIGRQNLKLGLEDGTFRRELATSRTFTNRAEIEHLHRIGLARGGSLKNAVVVDDDRILNPDGLRVRDEFVRHKMLDAVGDLFLAGGWLKARFVGHKSGHRLNNLLLRALFADSANWRETGSLPTQEDRRAA